MACPKLAVISINFVGAQSIGGKSFGSSSCVGAIRMPYMARLEDVADGLCSNASKYSDPAGTTAAGLRLLQTTAVIRLIEWLQHRFRHCNSSQCGLQELAQGKTGLTGVLCNFQPHEVRRPRLQSAPACVQNSTALGPKRACICLICWPGIGCDQSFPFYLLHYLNPRYESSGTLPGNPNC
jgi:hypothetical protein